MSNQRCTKRWNGRKDGTSDRQPIQASLAGWLASVVTLLTLCAMWTSSLAAQNAIDVRREYNVKAAMLYGFGRYITWPAEAFPDDSSPFVIGVLGEYPFGSALDRIAAIKTIQGRRIQTRRLNTITTCPDCQILFVTRTVSAKTEESVLKACRNKYVLLVGESPGFAKRGGIINFFLRGDTVRFEFNPEMAQKMELALNAKLYSLGVRVTSRD